VSAVNRIDARLAALKAAGRKALVPFVTAGDPSRESTVPVMHSLVEGGADLIELGVPFSDPMADGPVIQKSSERAIERKVGLSFVLEGVRQFRAADTATPVVLMGYLNPIEMRGVERFADEAAAAGVDGVLLVDLPLEEADPVREVFTARGLHLIALVAPTTTEARLGPLRMHAQGYLYYVSFAGVTGASKLDTGDVAAKAAILRGRRHRRQRAGPGAGGRCRPGGAGTRLPAADPRRPRQLIRRRRGRSGPLPAFRYTLRP